MVMQIKMLPEGIIALNKELATGYHQKLYYLLERHGTSEWEIRFAHIAAYCSIVLDDTYHPEDFDRLGHILAKRLGEMRELPDTQVIIPVPADIKIPIILH